jgi:lipopolysaccharide export system permease protein
LRIPFTSKLDRYLAGRFLVSILTVFGTCVGLILLVDFVEMLRRTGEVEGATIPRVLGLVILRLPAFTEILFPFAVLFGTMAALLRLSQKLELVVVRAAGVSVWQFMMPAVLIALGIGAFATLAYNPIAAAARELADSIESEFFGRRGSAVQSTAAGQWLRQEGLDGQFILNARTALDQGLDLRNVVIHAFDRTGNLTERVDAARAVLQSGYWRLEDAALMRVGDEPERYGHYLIATNLTQDQVRESLASVETISFYDLPRYITLSEQAGLPAIRLRLQYQTLLARPWLLTAMALIAATVSLRLFRLGNVLPMILGGVGAGFLLYVAMEIARQLGRSGVVADVWAAWTPVVVAMLTGLTILLHQEDG